MKKKEKKKAKKEKKEQKPEEKNENKEEENKTIKIKLSDGIYKEYKKEVDKCRDIEPDHCEEIKRRRFTNDPKDLFDEVKALEERYTYTINYKKRQMDQRILQTQKEYGAKYKEALEKKKKELDVIVKKLRVEIDKTIEYLEEREVELLRELENIYHEKKATFRDELVSILGFDFMK